MKHFIALLAFAALILPGLSHAEAADGPLSFEAAPGDTASVQRGARNFVNYCSGCHTLKYMRYNRLAADLGISKDTLKSSLMFVKGLKTGSHMTNAMSAAEATKWFGKVPPDLTLEAEFKDPQWIYNYLQSFYLDPSRPMGVNNPLLPNVAMPNVLWSLQGWQKQVTDKDGESHLEAVSKGSMSEKEFQGFVGDIVNFLTYAAAPEHTMRMIIGPPVLIYLLIMFVLCYLLKKEFWRDVHH